MFLIDGSWSIGDDNFQKIIRFLYSTTGALDQIGAGGTQVLWTPNVSLNHLLAFVSYWPITPKGFYTVLLLDLQPTVLHLHSHRGLQTLYTVVMETTVPNRQL